MKLFAAIKSYIRRRFYIVGIGQRSDSRYNTITKASKNIKWLKYENYKKDWIADPFVYKVEDDVMTIFAEQMDSSTEKGKLVKIDISLPKMEILTINTMLELDTHLSFPIFLKYDDQTYVYPENYQSGALKIYKYNDKSGLLENPEVLINEPLLDAQIFEKDDYFYVMGVKYDSGTMDDTRHLYVWRSPSLFGQYTLLQVIHSEDNSERGAGKIFKYNDEYYRPVQDCNGDYGRKVIFKKLTFKDDKITETTVGSYLPSYKYPEGLHTFNEYNNFEIIDGFAYNIGNLVTYINRIRR